MTVRCLEPPNLSEAMRILNCMAEKYPRSEFVFRGQSDFNWDLRTSYARYWGGRSQLGNSAHVEGIVARFRAGLARLGLGKDAPGANDLLSWLEFGRHHGLPAPLLDFTWSPYVALFFAFDGIRNFPAAGASDVALYALDLTQLAKEMARRTASDPDDCKEVSSRAIEFLDKGEAKFGSSLPEEKLLFIRHPSAHTRRMIAQLGVFLYVAPEFCGESGRLEDFFQGINEGSESPVLPNSAEPVLAKIKLSCGWAKEVFSSLELMSINGATMFDSPEGVARDVFNYYNYDARAVYLRD